MVTPACGLLHRGAAGRSWACSVRASWVGLGGSRRTPTPYRGADSRRSCQWLTAGGQSGHGYVGEVGWPGDDPRWATLATAWYQQAGEAWLWTSAWATGDWWSPSYRLANYTSDGTQITGPNPQPAIIEAQAPRKRSVNIAEAEFGTPRPTATISTFSNRRPGVVAND